MSSPTRAICLVAWLLGLSAAGPVLAEGPGQEDLDRATSVIITAKSRDELSEVIELCRGALKKGLDEENADYGRSLLASTLSRRGIHGTRRLGAVAPLSPEWQKQREQALADLQESLELNAQQPEALLHMGQLNLLPGGDAARAREAIDRAIELSADDPLRRAKGLVLRAAVEKDRERRLADLDEAIRLAPYDATAVRARGLLRANLGKLEEALADVEKALELDPDHRATYEARAVILARLDRPDEALAALDEAARLDPESIVPLLQKARIYAQRGNAPAAIEQLDLAHELAPDNVPLLLLRAEVHQKAGNAKQMLDDLELVVQLQPGNVGAWQALGRGHLLPSGDARRAAEALDRVLELAVDQPERRAEALVLRATLDDDPVEKQGRLDEAIRLDPNQPAAYRARGLLRAEQGHLGSAIADLDRAIELDPHFLPVYDVKALAFVKAKRFDAALATYDEAARHNPDSTRPLMQKARLHNQQGNHEAALADVDEALKLNADDTMALLLRAGIYKEMEQPEKALADVDATLKLEPDFPPAMRFRATLLADLERTDEGIAVLEQLVELHPDDTGAMLQLAMFYAAQRQNEKAVELYAQVLEKDADDWLAMRGRADALLNLGRHREAIDDYDKALKLRPQDVGILNNLAWVLCTSPRAELRDGTRAVALASQAARLTNHKQPHILSTLAAAYAETGDFSKAIEWAQRGADLSQDEEKEAVNKELQSYRDGHPWRELLSNGERVEPE